MTLNFSAVTGPLANSTISYTYDEYGRVKQRQLDGAANSVTRVFDNLGRVTSETNPLGTFTHGYVGSTGRLDNVSNGLGFKTAYDYWPSVPNPNTNGDGDLRLKAIKHYTNTTTLDADQTYHYTKSGNISQWVQRWGNVATGADYGLRYDSADQLIGAERRDLAVPAVLQREEAWSYDAAGNRELAQASVRQGNGSYAADITRTSHNNLNQMTSRTGGTGNMRFEGTVNERATVMVNNVRAGMKSNVGGAGYRWSVDAPVVAGANNVAITATDAQGNITNKTAAVTSSGAAIPALTYDLAGNLLSDGTRTYEWDAANRLITINYAGSNNRTEFTYDGLGRRTRIVEVTNNVAASPQLYIWDGLTIAEERNGTNTTTNRFYSQGESQGESQGTLANPTLLFYRRDHLGSIRETTDATGLMNVRIEYDLWGKRTVLSGATNPQPTFGYTGHYFHAKSGLHLAPYRAYSAESGTWISRDPIAEMGGLNLYSYVKGNPANFVDEEGLAPVDPEIQKKIEAGGEQAVQASAAHLKKTGKWVEFCGKVCECTRPAGRVLVLSDLVQGYPTFCPTAKAKCPKNYKPVATFHSHNEGSPSPSGPDIVNANTGFVGNETYPPIPRGLPKGTSSPGIKMGVIRSTIIRLIIHR